MQRYKKYFIYSIFNLQKWCKIFFLVWFWGVFVLELLYFCEYFEGMVRVACSMLYPIFGFWWGYCIFVVFVIVLLTIYVEWNKKGIDLMSMPFIVVLL